jgi:hypothetical protein
MSAWDPVIGDLILQSVRGPKSASISMSDYGFPVFRWLSMTTSNIDLLDVK